MLLLVLAVLLVSPCAARALAADEYKAAAQKAAGYLLAQEKANGRPLSSWSYVALGSAGDSFLAGARVMDSCGQQFAGLESGDTNAYSALILTLLAAGVNPQDYQGQNLVQKLRAAQLPGGKFADYIDGKGMGDADEQVLLNAHLWAVLALHSAGSGPPDPRKAVQWLIDQQHPDGSFNWNLKDNKPDVDSTGMALMALGVLGEKADSPAVQRAAAYLRSVQDGDGGFASWGAANMESCSMTITGLIAVGINPAGADWTKTGGNPVTAMLAYQLPDGSFEHVRGAGSDEMATGQAIIALTNISSGKTLFDRLRERSGLPPSPTGSTQAERVIRFKPGEAKYEVITGGQKHVYEADASPFLENGRTYVPVRYLALALGVPEADIGWSPAEQAVKLVNKGITVTLPVGKNTIYINGQPSPMDVSPLLLPPGRTFLPARFVAEAFGFRVQWLESEQAVLISTVSTH